MARVIDLNGMVFGRLFVLKEYGRSKDRHVLWKCLCVCGNEVIVSGRDLRNGHTSSCGCFQKERVAETFYKHGHRVQGKFTRIYRIWLGMKDRCCNPKNKEYSNYGEKDISVCEEWLTDFSNFYNWAITNGYADELEIDRIKNELGYFPQNCRWVTEIQQARNTSKCIYQIVDGRKMCLSEISEKFGITESALYWRYHHQNKRNEELLKEG